MFSVAMVLRECRTPCHNVLYKIKNHPSHPMCLQDERIHENTPRHNKCSHTMDKWDETDAKCIVCCYL